MPTLITILKFHSAKADRLNKVIVLLYDTIKIYKQEQKHETY